MNNHQKSTFHPLGDFLNPALALLGQGLRKSPIWQKLNFANHPYLCKGLIKNKLGKSVYKPGSVVDGHSSTHIVTNML
ncbi:hypothetical protein BHECKSOX2_664 [Bathymodiolus heckerae thiotrophic gill symbiont]|nr:hypothetical protein BHECKSOX2_664 [Bathymodiolus heckerae thiotrophic gill symbiont]